MEFCREYDLTCQQRQLLVGIVAELSLKKEWAEAVRRHSSRNDVS